MSVFADGVMESSSLVQGEAILLFVPVYGGMQQCCHVCSDFCFTICLFLLVVHAWLEDPVAATAEGWRKQSDGTEAAKEYFVHQQLCVLRRETAAGDEFTRWQLPMKSSLAKPIMEKV